MELNLVLCLEAGNITCALVTPTRFEFNDDNDDEWVYKETWNLANQLAIALTDCRHRKYIHAQECTFGRMRGRGRQ